MTTDSTPTVVPPPTPVMAPMTVSHGFVIICLYVDDMLIMGSNNEVIKTTKEMFNNKFDMKDLGVADVILGIKISKTSDGLILSQ